MEKKLIGKTLGIIHAAVFTANTVAPYCQEIIPEVEEEETVFPKRNTMDG